MAVLATSGAEKGVVVFFQIKHTQSTPFDPKLMSGVFSQFLFRSTKLVGNRTPRTVLATSGAKKVAVDFIE